MTEIDLDALEALANAQLVHCGSCDFGMPMTCACPKGDPRSVISQLVEVIAEVRQLREDLTSAREQLILIREERDRYKTLFDEKVVDRRRLVGLMRADGNELRLLREQRDQVLAECAAYNRADQPVAWQLARKLEAIYAAKEQK